MQGYLLCRAHPKVTSTSAPSFIRFISTSRAVGATPESVTLPSTTWTPESLRSGLIARKRGMAAIWDSNGKRMPVTILQVDNCQVTANIITLRRYGEPYIGMQLAATDKRPKVVNNQMKGHFAKAGVNPKQIVKEFKVSRDALLPVGTTLSAIHFVPGQFVDVAAKSIGKGYQGPMKRWNFRGLRASHGVSISHRSGGSTGQHQDPGRVFPGKKMAGRMGGGQITTQNLHVVRVDTSLNLIFVKGCVPGVDNAHVFVTDAKKNMLAVARARQQKGLTPPECLPFGVDGLPFPAGTAELAESLPKIMTAPTRGRNPFVPLD